MWDLLWMLLSPIGHLFWRALETFYPNESGWYVWAWLNAAFMVILVIALVIMFGSIFIH